MSWPNCVFLKLTTAVDLEPVTLFMSEVVVVQCNYIIRLSDDVVVSRKQRYLVFLSLFLWTRTCTHEGQHHISPRNQWFSVTNKRDSMKYALYIYQIGSWILIRMKHRVRQSCFLGIWSDLFKGKVHPKMKNSVNIRFHGPQTFLELHNKHSP